MSLKSEMKAKIATLMTGAFGFVAALQWNEAIKKWMEPITSAGEGAIPLTIVAVVVTIIAVVAIVGISKLSK